MNDWYPDLLVAQRRIADRMAEAAQERIAKEMAPKREALRLRVHIDLQVTFGRAAARGKPV